MRSKFLDIHCQFTCRTADLEHYYSRRRLLPDSVSPLECSLEQALAFHVALSILSHVLAPFLDTSTSETEIHVLNPIWILYEEVVLFNIEFGNLASRVREYLSALGFFLVNKGGCLYQSRFMKSFCITVTENVQLSPLSDA